MIYKKIDFSLALFDMFPADIPALLLATQISSTDYLLALFTLMCFSCPQDHFAPARNRAERARNRVDLHRLYTMWQRTFYEHRGGK